jgi:diguanylate cyclase (GGDEF)-like protein
MDAVTPTTPDAPGSRPGGSEALRRAQRLRVRRVLWGATAYGVEALIALGCHWAGLLEARRLVHFVLAVAAINAAFLALIASGINLRFRDPSLTAAQVVASLWPSIYVMYHVTEPQARMPFLLMAMVAMMFGVLVLDLGRMLLVGAVVLGSYLVMLVALAWRAPERVDLVVEPVVVFAYAAVLVQVSLLGSYISGLRLSLKERNLELQETMAELEELASRDPLTHLPNRRAVMLQLEREQARILRRRPTDQTACICVVDIDFFKQINDSYGHQAGDAVLRAVGEAIEKTLRSGDFAGRLGGEEFLLLLPESSADGAVSAAERVRSAIGALRIPELPAGSRVEVSVGVASNRADETLENTLRRADDALYVAKQTGRARVVVDDSPAGAETGESPRSAAVTPAEGGPAREP